MAKPKHAWWNNCAPSSSSNHANHLISPVPRHRPSLRSQSSSPSPSPAVLSALAIIATTTPVVAGGPLPIQTTPPSFLCPFIERDNIHPTSIPPTSPPVALQAASTPTPAFTPAPQNSIRQPIADKYVKGSDNLWRKTNAWTLYGSTCCSGSTSTSVAQSEPTTISSTPSPSSSPSSSSSTTTSMPTSSPSASDFDTSVLPAGWVSPTSSNTESTIILALAIVLAGSICVFMLGCVIWRRRKRKSRDTERKIAHKNRPDDASEDDDRGKDARGKMRIWAKASARWKINIRHAARRRRKKTSTSSRANHPRSPTPNDSREVLAGISSALSRRGSFISQDPCASRPETSSSLNSTTTTPPERSFTSILSPPLSPPIYGSPVEPRLSSRIPSSNVADSNVTSSIGSSHPFKNCSYPSTEEDEPLPYLLPSDGHVATDDKAQLARIHGLASSPQDIPNDSSASISAPAWHEVEDSLDDLGIDFGETLISVHTVRHPPLFPLPPVPPNIPSSYLDSDPFHYGEEGDIRVPVPIPEPSTPSFEASPSAPPIGDLDLEASAPSLEGEDVYEDWESAADSSHPSSAVLPPTRHSIARDSALPRYQP